MGAAATAIVGALALSSAREGARMTPDALLAAIKTATTPGILDVVRMEDHLSAAGTGFGRSTRQGAGG